MTAPTEERLRFLREGPIIVVGVPQIAPIIGDQPSTVNLSLYAGDDLFLRVHVTNADGTPADLTGYTPKAQIRYTPADSAILAEFDCTIEANDVVCHLSSVDSATLDGAAVWDLQLTDGAGVVNTLAAGRVFTQSDVTR